MSKTVTIPLDEPFAGHKGMTQQLVLRRPNWSDVMGVGAPYTIHSDKEGKGFLVYDEAAIAHYAEALLIEPADTALVSASVGLRDTMKVREAIVDFFLAAAGAGGGSGTSPKSSSSTSDSSPTGSDA